MPLESFFDTFLNNDRTVIMLNEQNNHSAPPQKFVEIDNAEAELFPNGSLVGWKHRKKEREFLRQLYSGLLESQKK